MVTVLNGEDILSLFAFTALWIQPVIWAMLKKVQNRKLDALLLVGVILALGSYFSLVFLGVLEKYPQLFLYYFYGGLGATISLAFFALHGWRYTQALSVSALALFVSSTLWELPLLLVNAVRTGPEPDWILHLMVLFYIGWIKEWPGWKIENLIILIFPLAVSIMVFSQFPITPPGLASEWNSLPYLFIRSFSAYIVYLMINKEPKP